MDNSWYNKIDSLYHSRIRFSCPKSWLVSQAEVLKEAELEILKWRLAGKEFITDPWNQIPVQNGKEGKNRNLEKWRWCAILRLKEDLEKLGLGVVWASVSLGAFVRPGRATTLEDGGKEFPRGCLMTIPGSWTRSWYFPRPKICTSQHLQRRWVTFWEERN